MTQSDGLVRSSHGYTAYTTTAARRKHLQRQKVYRIKLPDAIIAATALAYDLTLLTRNTADFGGIGGLKIINPWEK